MAGPEEAAQSFCLSFLLSGNMLWIYHILKEECVTCKGVNWQQRNIKCRAKSVDNHLKITVVVLLLAATTATARAIKHSWVKRQQCKQEWMNETYFDRPAPLCLHRRRWWKLLCWLRRSRQEDRRREERLKPTVLYSLSTPLGGVISLKHLTFDSERYSFWMTL